MKEGNWRDELIADSNRYREKWAVWKGAYYAGVMTVCGVFIAIAPVLASSHGLSKALTKVLLLLSVTACVCVIWNLLALIELYDALGFDQIPLKFEELESYRKEHEDKIAEYIRNRNYRRLRDDLVKLCLVGSTACFAVALFL